MHRRALAHGWHEYLGYALFAILVISDAMLNSGPHPKQQYDCPNGISVVVALAAGTSDGCVSLASTSDAEITGATGTIASSIALLEDDMLQWASDARWRTVKSFAVTRAGLEAECTGTCRHELTAVLPAGREH